MTASVRASAGTTIDIDLVNRVLLQPHWQNEVDLMMKQGHDFVPAVSILENWLEQYQRELRQA